MDGILEIDELRNQHLEIMYDEMIIRIQIMSESVRQNFDQLSNEIREQIERRMVKLNQEIDQITQLCQAKDKSESDIL